MQLPTHEQILPYIAEGWIAMNTHPDNPDVKLFNYTKECQYARKWDDVTRQCRCLIMNIKTGEVLARPIPKFFNYEEWISMGNTIPDGTPIVIEKLDGMLGILYWLDGKPWIASRGSFTSEPATWATEWIRKPENAKKIALSNKGWTYVFEIIYPASRIVLKYDFSDLVWLGEVNIKTGVFQPSYYNSLGFRVPELYEFLGVDTLLKANVPNKEGYVLHYRDLLLKIKFDEYVRLHKIMTGLSMIGIWEHLQVKGLDASPTEVVQDVPDEFFSWLTQVMDDLKAAYRSIEAEAREPLNRMADEMYPGGAYAERRDRAELIKTRKYPSISFAMLDNKNYQRLIWQMIRPHGNKTFKIEI